MPNAKRSLPANNRKAPRKAEPKPSVRLRRMQTVSPQGSEASAIPETGGMAERSSEEQSRAENWFPEYLKRFLAENKALNALPVGPNRTEREMVNHPAHYGGDTEHEAIRCLKAWGLESDALLWNAVKYIAGSAKKGRQLEDLEKASFYLSRRIEALRSGDSLVARGTDGSGSPG